MTRKKSATTSKTTFDARDVFLATLGLYAKVYEQGNKRAAEVKRKREVMFKELVARGEKLEKQARKKLAELKTSNPALETGIDNLLANFNKLQDMFGKPAQVSSAKAKAV